MSNEKTPVIELLGQSAKVPPRTSLEDFQKACSYAAWVQRAVHWWLGDLANAAERQYPDEHFQAWDEWVSPEMLDRCKAIASAYSPEERNILATWSTHMHLSKRPDRVEAVQATVEAGQTSDDVRKNPPPPQWRKESPVQEEAPTVEVEQTASPVAPAETTSTPAVAKKWLLAVDVNLFVSRFYESGGGSGTAKQVADWLCSVVERLQGEGLTDAVCAFDSSTNHRKQLTAGWEKPYKNRGPKDKELVEQLLLCERFLHERNMTIVKIPDMEADDVMASYAKQFDGKVTLMTQDKDMRQCLSSTCNILTDATWEEHPETKNMVPLYQWIKERWTDQQKARWEANPEDKPKNVKSHFDDGVKCGKLMLTGITPEQWPHFQAIAGDSVDDITGVVGIGGKGANDLIKAHGTVQAVIAACKDNTADVSAIKRLAILDFEPLAETMLKLTTLRTDLDVPKTTAICMRSPGQ